MKYLALLVALLGCGCSQIPRDIDVSRWVSESSRGLPEKLPSESLRQMSSEQPSVKVSPDKLAKLAKDAESREEWDAAIRAYEDLMMQQPEALEPIHRLAVLHDRKGLYPEATRLYLKALRKAPRDPALLADYAYSRYLQGDLGVAKEMLQRALEVDPKFDRAHNNLALVLAREGHDEQALAAFQNGGLSRPQAIANLQHAQRAEELSRQAKPSAVARQGDSTTRK